MKREIEEEKLPAFNLSASELELLWGAQGSSLTQEKKLQSRLHLTLLNEKLQFDDFEELRSYGRVRGRVTQFEIEFSQENRSVSVRSAAPNFRPTATVRVQADSDVGCAGAVQPVVLPNRTWYWWFANWPFLLTFFILSMLSLLSSWLGLDAPLQVLPELWGRGLSVVVLVKSLQREAQEG